MNTHLLSLSAAIRAIIIIGSTLFIGILAISTGYAQTAPPPSFGEETKGAPATEEPISEATTTSAQTTSGTESPKAAVEEETENDAETQSTSVFGTATVVESRRENGQVYSIELQHSNAPTQYIEETDSDGNIEYKSNNIETTPNLPKWKLGSW